MTILYLWLWRRRCAELRCGRDRCECCVSVWCYTFIMYAFFERCICVWCVFWWWLLGGVCGDCTIVYDSKAAWWRLNEFCLRFYIWLIWNVRGAELFNTCYVCYNTFIMPMRKIFQNFMVSYTQRVVIWSSSMRSWSPQVSIFTQLQELPQQNI